VHLVILPAALGNDLELPRIGHDHLVPHGLQQPADPGRLRAHFHCNPALFHRTVQRLHPGYRGRHAAFFHHLARTVENAVSARAIPQVHSDRDRTFPRLIRPLHFLCFAVILFHAGLLLHLDCVPIGKLNAIPPGDRPSHPISEVAAEAACTARWSTTSETPSMEPPESETEDDNAEE